MSETLLLHVRPIETLSSLEILMGMEPQISCAKQEAALSPLHILQLTFLWLVLNLCDWTGVIMRMIRSIKVLKN